MGVLASASVPVIFEPQIIDGKTMSMAVFENLPARCICDFCRFLIGVHVNRNEAEENIQGVKAIAERTFRLVFAKNVVESFALCDFIIDPPQPAFLIPSILAKPTKFIGSDLPKPNNVSLSWLNLVDLNSIIQRKEEKQQQQLDWKPRLKDTTPDNFRKVLIFVIDDIKFCIDNQNFKPLFYTYEKVNFYFIGCGFGFVRPQKEIRANAVKAG